MAEDKTILENLFKNLKLDDIMNTAIINSLNDEVKENLSKQILSYVSSKKDGYSYSKTVLEEMFFDSIRTPLRNRMEKIISEDPRIMQEVDNVVKIATEKFLALDKEKMAQDLANTLHNAFRKNSY